MTEILVIGAGPTGLALACLLASHGTEVRVVDRLTAPSPLAKAMVVWSRSLEILDGLGIARDAAAAGLALERARYLDGSRVLASVRTNRIRGTSWQPLILPQNALEMLLRERLRALGTTVEWDTEVIAVTDVGDGVSATLRGADGSTERCSAAYAVGCDGLRSIVREAARIGWHAHAAYEEVFQLGDVEAETTLDRTAVHQFLGRTGASVAIPMPDDRWRLVGYFDGEDPEERPDRHTLQRLLDQVGHRGTTVGTVHWSGSFRVVRRLADDFRAGRLLLAGDAAHVHSPAGGQGLNTGIQDAENLAWKLSLVVRRRADEALLDSYTTERRPIAARILALTTLQDKHLFGARSRRSRLLRDAALRIADRTGILERGLIPDLAQVKVRYKHSSLTVSGGARLSRHRVPGRRLPHEGSLWPDASERDRPRARSHAAVMTLVATPGRDPGRHLADLADFIAGYPGALALSTLAATLPGTTGRRAGTLIGVRPDGYIGYRGPCAVTPALRRWVDAAVARPT